MARRKRRFESENHDRWLVSYADFVTLLFAFFVVMYSISSVNEAKYRTFSDSLSIAFSHQPDSSRTSIVPVEPEQLLKALVDKRTARLVEQQRRIRVRMQNLASGLNHVLAPQVRQHLVSITPNRRGVVINISASSLFKTGEAEIQPGALEVLRQVSAVLRNEKLPIEVEGHTDDIPIMTAQYPSNWELSSARASSVVRMMIKNGVPGERMAAVGLASNHPLVPNDTPEDRDKNRRVSITIVAPNLERSGPDSE